MRIVTKHCDGCGKDLLKDVDVGKVFLELKNCPPNITVESLASPDAIDGDYCFCNLQCLAVAVTGGKVGTMKAGE